MAGILTNQQQIYRAYLCSPVWQQKRLAALEHYGCICNRCGEHGTDVHHKTYERVGGDELMEDLEILCRPCHEAHHRVDKMVSRTPNKASRGINRKAILPNLGKDMKAKLKREHGLSTDGELYLKILRSDDDLVARSAARLLGCAFVFGEVKEKRRMQRVYGHNVRRSWLSI